eukprot:756632-Hanusia_phi.AAC.3
MTCGPQSFCRDLIEGPGSLRCCASACTVVECKTLAGQQIIDRPRLGETTGSGDSARKSPAVTVAAERRKAVDGTLCQALVAEGDDAVFVLIASNFKSARCRGGAG